MPPVLLVTGATGFIGSNFCNTIAARGVPIHALCRFPSRTSILDSRVNVHLAPHPITVDFVYELMNRIQVTDIVHAATHFTSNHGSDDVAKIISANIDLGVTILEAAVQSTGAQFINLSSYWQRRSSGEKTLSLYGASKNAFMEFVHYYEASKNLPTKNVFIFDTYGVSDTRQKLVSLLIDAARTGRALRLTSGTQTIGLVHVNDVVEGIWSALVDQEGSREFWLTPEETHTIREVAESIVKISDRPIDAVWGALPDPDVTDLVFDEEMLRPPGWAPQVSLETGLLEVWQHANLSDVEC